MAAASPLNLTLNLNLNPKPRSIRSSPGRPLGVLPRVRVNPVRASRSLPAEGTYSVAAASCRSLLLIILIVINLDPKPRSIRSSLGRPRATHELQTGPRFQVPLGKRDLLVKGCGRR